MTTTISNPSTVSQRITTLREKRGWSKAKVCRDLGIKAPCWHGYENGRTPRSLILARIADYFGVTMHWLITGETASIDPKSVSKILAKAINANTNAIAQANNSPKFSCPFCNSYKVKVATFVHVGNPEVYSVMCKKCEAQGPLAPTPKDAIAVWNKRS